MGHSVFYRIDATILCLLLFAGCILMVIFGKLARKKFIHKDDEESKGGVNSVLGALFGLWGFILAFTFGNSASRFENVRAMMVEEANIIRNVLLRTETLPDSLQGAFRSDLRMYLDARINYYDLANDPEKFNKSIKDAVSIGKRLWTKSVHASHVPEYNTEGSGMMTTLTSMFDIGARRDAILKADIPLLISFMLFFLALIISFIGGFTSPVLKSKEWVVIAAFILIACTIIYITLDLSRPMKGLIRPDVGQEKLVLLRNLF